VLCDVAGAGPLVTTRNFDRLRPMNFGAGVMVNPVEAKYLRAEVERYSADDAAAVSQRVRAEAGLKETTRLWIELYADVLNEFSLAQPGVKEEQAAAAAYRRKWSKERRIEWMKSQFRRLRSVPLVGSELHHLGRRIVREWTKNPEL